MLGPMVIAVLLPLLVIGGYCLARHDPRRRSRFARWVALVTAALVAVLVGMFLAGEALSDPGGVHGALLVAAWLVPLVVLVVIAWRMPRAGPIVLGVCAGLAALLTLSELLWADQWRNFQNSTGPVLGVVGFVLLVPLAVAGLRRPGFAGGLLVGLAVVGLVVEGVAMRGSGAPLGAAAGGSSAALAMPLAVVGLLLLIAAGLGRLGVRVETASQPAGHHAPGPSAERLDSPQETTTEAHS